MMPDPHRSVSTVDHFQFNIRFSHYEFLYMVCGKTNIKDGEAFAQAQAPRHKSSWLHRVMPSQQSTPLQHFGAKAYEEIAA